MNGLDIFIAAVVFIGLFRGFFRGFISEISSIVGLIAGFYGACTYSRLLAGYLKPWLSDFGVYADIISFCLLFCIIASASASLAYVIREFLKVVFLGWVDRLLGVIFGALKGFLFATVVFMMLTAFWPGEPQFVAKSKFAPYVAHVSEVATVFISKEIRGDLKIKIDRIKEIWKQQKKAIEIKNPVKST